ncbi:caspase family protein [Flavobacteriales bacterium]|nr:caspase family protein [Flavobacteriales bacterium]
MKKIIIILICFPTIGFGQTLIKCVDGDCDNGKGIKNYQDRLYEGEFKNGKADGSGYCDWYNGDKYEGDWKNGNPSGEGSKTYVNGDKYMGEWENGKQNGFGTYIWPDGTKFEGEWKNNVQDGEGIHTYADYFIGCGFNQIDHAKTSKLKTDRIITRVYAGSPAERAGLLVGDVILSVNKIHFEEWDMVSKIIGKKHKFYIQRNKEKPKNIKVRIGKVSRKGSPDIMSYDGEWIGNNYHGIGTAIYYDGVKEKGVWKDGDFIKSLVVEDRIKKIVERKINEWQKKGEFEKTSTYQERVKEKNRDSKVKEFQELAMQNLKSEFCESVDFSNIELSQYDPDNETFILKEGRYLPSYYAKYYPLGDIVIPIPIDTAKNFKKNFSSFKFENLDCIIDDDNFILSYVELHGEDQKKSEWFVDSTWNAWDSTYTVSHKEKFYYEHPVYTYRLDDAQDYTMTDINYAFSPIVIDEVEDAMITKKSVISNKKLKVGASDVNKDIPKNKTVNHRYALIIGNEDYQSRQKGLSTEHDVPYAINDASIFREYALKTLGVKKENMYDIFDASAVEMHRKIKLISKIMKNEGSKAELIVYYAGHGQPEEVTHIPYLIPVDVSVKDLSFAIKLDDFYKDLSATGANKIIIFLDACFTGGGRETGLMASSRGVKVKPKEEMLNGNLLVFSASSGEESALPYDKEEHGMFTYYLLKKLQESGGDVSMGELADYLTDKVSLESLKINEKEQNPTINFSPKIENNWRNWKL